jgi:flagellar protein FlgJ
VPAEALLAQAALESGWGRHVMQDGEGRSSHNLFGIKADRRWSGERVSVDTLEYRDNVAIKTRADFRAYSSFADSFADYADFIGANQRYRPALEVGADSEAYLRGLQQAGYATDPAYADKIVAILRRPEFAGAAEPLRVAQR